MKCDVSKSKQHIFYSSKPRVLSVCGIYVMRDFYSWWYTWWVDGQTDTLIPYWRVGVPTLSCKNGLENEGSCLREDEGWMKIWSKFINFMKALANAIMDLLTKFQTIWTIQLSLKFARSDLKTDERKYSHGVIRKFISFVKFLGWKYCINIFKGSDRSVQDLVMAGAPGWQSG